MDNRGFTLVELLAVIIIMGLIMIIAIPTYVTTFSKMKANNLLNKVSELESAALEYSSTRKDEIKSNLVNITGNNTASECLNVSIEDIIKNGYIKSDSEQYAKIKNPVTGSYLTGYMLLCYCYEDYDVHAYYVENFSKTGNYYEDQYVVYNDYIYRVIKKYNALGKTPVDATSYFEKITRKVC